MIRWLVGLICLGFAATSALAADPVMIGVGYLGIAGTRSTLSLVEQPAENDGVAGARLAIEDNNTTGKFLNQRFALEERRIKEGEDAVQAATELAARNGFIIADLPADTLLKVADALRERGTLLFNAGAIDERLREADCRANVIHTAPTRAMLADALGQYLVWKQWKRWLLVVGSHDEDRLFADALRRTATRFGAKIVQERSFEDKGGARRTDSGVTLIQRPRCRCSRNKLRPMMYWSPLTRARCSAPTCPIAPGIHGLSRARPASCRGAGTLRRTSGARSRCRTASSSSTRGG
ncbi:hypothetical protein ACVWXL_004972 [Bradyrhizobium sp. GM22.5]